MALLDEILKQVQPERDQDIGQGKPGVEEEDQGGHQNTPREA